MVAAPRLRAWISRYVARHGAPEVDAGPVQLRLNAPDGDQAWLDIPFPPLPSDQEPLAQLIVHVERDRRIGVLLVRRGGVAVGVFDGDHLVTSKVGSAYVQGTTKAGGWSQQRFARRRDNQARDAFRRAADVAHAVLGPYAGELDALVVGGDRSAVDTVLADDRLRRLQALRVGPLLAVPDPRLRVLEATPEQFRAVRIALYP
ncbi:MAG: hypothetical protein JO147_11985 [Actinobacteria bacterium]|nr:hypothetical protein [Actinomycetota bacterium]